MHNDKTFNMANGRRFVYANEMVTFFIYELLEPQTALEWSLFFTR